MDRPHDLKRVLAEEVRAAIAEASPAREGRDASGDPSAREARAALRRAEDVMTPAVPDEAPLAAVKRLAIRGLRFLWRNQSSFNSQVLAAASGLGDGLDRLRPELDEIGRRCAVQEARLTLIETSSAAPRGAPAAAPGPMPDPEFPAGVYALFEERFRGSPDEIARGQRFYLETLKGVPGPVLDLGCGRGEFLGLLREAGLSGSGIESNPVSVEACRQAGLEVESGDALELLARRPGGKLGAVVAFQVVEHWAPATILKVFQEARRALAPGGVLIAETINADSLAALRAFYLDPTHVRPVPAEALRFLAEAAGFGEIRIEFRAPFAAAQRLAETTENDRKLNALLFAPQDYALIGRVPASA